MISLLYSPDAQFSSQLSQILYGIIFLIPFHHKDGWIYYVWQHDLLDLKELLEQSKDAGIDIYTHCEMLPAHYSIAEEKYKAATSPFKHRRCALIRNTILAPGLSSAALAKEEGRKLHPSSSAPQITPRQARGATSSTFAQGYGGQASKASGIL